MKKILISILLLILISMVVTGQDQASNVLIIHSYYEHFPWTRGLQEGIEAGMTSSDHAGKVNFYLEYLDENRLSQNVDFDQLAEIYKEKYKGIYFDCIVAGDNYALEFLNAYYDKCFEGVPLVYVGINNMTRDMLFTEEMTGLSQVNDHVGMLKLVESLHPEMSGLVIAGSNNKTSQGESAMYEKALSTYALQVPVDFIKEDMLEDFYKKMADYDEDTVVIVTSLMKDPAKSNQLEGYIGDIISQINLPVYVPVEVMMGTSGYGAVGGLIQDPYDHGLIAADMVMDILYGRKASTIPRVWHPIITPKFNYDRLEEFDIDEENLPADSIIVGKPNTNQTFVIVLLIVLSLVIVILLIYSFIQRFQISTRQKVTLELEAHNDELMAKNSEIEFLHHHDSLTGFFTRQRFIDELDDLLFNTSSVYIYAINILNIKTFDESYGYDVSDMARMKIADIIRQVFKECYPLFGRYYDNYYIAIASHDIDYVDYISQQLYRALSTTVKAGEYDLDIQAKLGVAKAEDDDAYDLIRKADITLINAITKSKNFSAFFDHNFYVQMDEKISLENAMKEALIQGEFELYYQPQVDAVTGRTKSCEALIRWFKKDGSAVSPNVFIPIAEEIGLIDDIGEWVILNAFKTQKKWYDQGINCKISINISARQIDRFLIEILKKASRQYDTKAENICLEITETAVMNESHNNIAVLNEIAALGFKIALDDFGVGHSSLRYIKDFPIHELKIDKSFIDHIEQPEQLAIVKAMYQLASIFNYTIVAEGVETLEQVEILKDVGIHLIQGYYYSKALNACDFYDYYKNNQGLELVT
ncbi:EAL domain-containing protein [Acidaminobacter sp. JC074]|uniref:bifunctional diguanylate cyclase/phosphodiesterase n=1 Tax=Acidaminobacter sp. JC074 TaxID=2530199 RepID=UPI001F0EB584|nr:bifunctional diguanylate cyclase/phosphodiesterase [Acidaminobacter sp. JC074]MCH4890331.1 EAL domain-containing protein [Acidaminobacter sp. JC074]